MSVVAVKITPEEINISADSIIVSNDFIERQVMNESEGVKLFQVGEITFGSVGKLMECNLFKLYCKTHQPKQADIDSLLEYFAEFIDWMKKYQTDFKLYNQFIFIFEKKCFLIRSNLSISEITNYESIGAGRIFALTALYLDKTPQHAVQIACDLSIYCTEPIQTITIKLSI